MKNASAFTLLEMIIALSIFSLLVLTTAPPMVTLLLNNQTKLADEELVHTLRHARERSTAQINDSAWGVYFDVGSDSYTLFAGSSYATRDSSHDRVTNLPDSVTFGDLDLSGGGSEVIFSQITGLTSQDGSIELVTNGDSLIITINTLGNVLSN